MLNFSLNQRNPLLKNSIQKFFYGAAMMLATIGEAVTNIVYAVEPEAPQVCKAGQRLMLNVAWKVGENARGFVMLRFVSGEPECAASPAFSMMLCVDGSFDLLPPDSAAKRTGRELRASRADTHTASVQIYPSAHATKFAGDFSGAWPRPLDCAGVRGNVEVVVCGEGISLATPPRVRWTANPTLFLVR